MGLVWQLNQVITQPVQITLGLQGLFFDKFRSDIGFVLDVFDSVGHPLRLFINGSVLDNRSVEETGAVLTATFKGHTGQVCSSIIDPRLLSSLISKRLNGKQEQAEYEGR